MKVCGGSFEIISFVNDGFIGTARCFHVAMARREALLFFTARRFVSRNGWSANSLSSLKNWAGGHRNPCQGRIRPSASPLSSSYDLSVPLLRSFG